MLGLDVDEEVSGGVRTAHRLHAVLVVVLEDIDVRIVLHQDVISVAAVAIAGLLVAGIGVGGEALVGLT